MSSDGTIMPCDICNKLFTSQNQMVGHMRTHIQHGQGEDKEIREAFGESVEVAEQSVIFNPASITTKTLKRIIKLKSPRKMKESETEYQGTRIEQRYLLKLLLDLKGAKTKEDWLACRKLIKKSGACWECGKRECWEERKIFNKTVDKDNYTKYVCKGQKIIGAFWNDQLDKPLRVKYVKEKKDKRKRNKKGNKPLKNNCNEAKITLRKIP